MPAEEFMSRPSWKWRKRLSAKMRSEGLSKERKYHAAEGKKTEISLGQSFAG